MAEIETKSQVTETTELTPEVRDGIAKAISNWIDDNSKEFEHIKSIRKGLVGNEAIRRDSIDLLLKKSRYAQIFFNTKYHNGKIDIEHNLKDGFLGEVLQGVMQDLDCQKKGETVHDAINRYCDSINIEELKDCKTQIQNSLGIAKNERNKTGSHPNKGTGMPATDDDWRETWRKHIVVLLIIGFVEYHKEKQNREIVGERKIEDIIKDCLSKWYDEPDHQSFNGVYPDFKKEFIDKKKNQIIQEIIPILNKKSMHRPLHSIISSLNEKQELVTAEGFPDMGKFAKELLYYTNCSIYSNVYGGCAVENSSFDNGFVLLEKLCTHIGKVNKSAITEIENGIRNIAQINADFEDFNVYFFRTLFLIGALKLCIKEMKSGVLFFTKDANVKVKLYEKAREIDLSKEDNPYYWNNFQSLFKFNDQRQDNASANCGNKSKNKSITIKKSRWCIVLIYFPDKGENKMEVVKETNFPGLENLDELWQEFIKVPEIENGNGGGDGGSIGGNPPIPTGNPLQQNKQAFNDYKEKIKSGLYDDFGVFIDHVNELVKAIDSLSYDENKGLDGNKTAVDTEEKKIRIELVNLRNQSFQERNQKDFKKCKEEYIKKIQKLSESNGNYYELIAKAQKEIEEQQYDDLKDFSSNEIALKNILEELNFNLHEREAFEKEKQSLLSELEQLDCKSKKGAFLKANAKERITDLRYDEFRADKVALMNIMVQLKKDLAKIGFLDISIEKTIIITQWIDKNWKWCALALCTIVLAIVLFVVFDGDDRVRIPIDEAVPSLESKSWRISEMDSKSVFGSAEVSSVDGSNTHYSLRHITETGKEIIVTFNVDWQTGTAMSPELGEGKIEKDSKLNTIKIIFEEWTISRYY